MNENCCFGRWEFKKPINLHQLAFEYPLFLPLAFVAAAVENDEETMVPGRVVPYVLHEHRVDKVELRIPHRVRVDRLLFVVGVVLLSPIRISAVKRRQEPLAIAPGMVVLGIDFQASLDDTEFSGWLFGKRY